MLYFAYGSNMHAAQMRARAPAARVVGRGYISGKRLLCNKQSVDGSGKANLVDDPDAVVWGVLYDLDPDELAKLDALEGGYQRRTEQVWSEEGTLVAAQVYISDQLTEEPVPSSAYKRLMVLGAKAHQLPETYIRDLECLPEK